MALKAGVFRAQTSVQKKALKISKMLETSPRVAVARAPVIAARARVATRAQASQQQQQDYDRSPTAAMLTAAAALSALAALPPAALAADEPEAAAAAAAAGAPTPAFWAVALTPIVVYALFWVYRDRVNPKATIGDLLYIVGAVVVLGNIFSILVFKTRFF